MRLFTERQIYDAYALASGGGQALHLFSDPGVYAGAPECFSREPRAGHLFDHDRPRLIATARRLGVRRTKVHHPGSPRQHIDLCGRPLDRAIAACEPEQTEKLKGAS